MLLISIVIGCLIGVAWSLAERRWRWNKRWPVWYPLLHCGAMLSMNTIVAVHAEELGWKIAGALGALASVMLFLRERGLST